jgi:hypothetical protein
MGVAMLPSRCVALMMAGILMSVVASVHAECVQDTKTYDSALNILALCEDGGPGILVKNWESATAAEKAKADAACEAATSRVQRTYGISSNDILALTIERSSHLEGRGIMGWLTNSEPEPRFPVAISFHCTDGKNRVMFRVRSSIWVQFPERFARSWFGGPPSAPESGHGPDWVPRDLFVVTDATRQGDLRAMPPRTIARNGEGATVQIGP